MDSGFFQICEVPVSFQLAILFLLSLNMDNHELNVILKNLSVTQIR
jgi:hypothetical protein